MTLWNVTDLVSLLYKVSHNCRRCLLEKLYKKHSTFSLALLYKILLGENLQLYTAAENDFEIFTAHLLGCILLEERGR